MLEYNIRPHHVLCTTFFEGKGYSPEFVRNMTRVIHNLEADSYIRLSDGVDCICSHCPNNKDDVCDHKTKVERFDKAVMSACKLEAGQLLKWQEFKKLALDKIIWPGKLSSICGDCQWSTICKDKAVKMIENRDKDN